MHAQGICLNAFSEQRTIQADALRVRAVSKSQVRTHMQPQSMACPALCRPLKAL